MGFPCSLLLLQGPLRKVAQSYPSAMQMVIDVSVCLPGILQLMLDRALEFLSRSLLALVHFAASCLVHLCRLNPPQDLGRASSLLVPLRTLSDHELPRADDDLFDRDAGLDFLVARQRYCRLEVIRRSQLQREI